MSVIETLRAASPRRRLLYAALAGVVACVLLCLAYVFLLRTPYAVLFNKLRPQDAATIVAELDRKKTPYELADGGATILVPAKLVDSTRLAVMSQDLPLKGVVGFELFNKSDMGLTEFAQKINYQRALQGELARTIMSLDSVDSARVHLTLPDPSIFRDDRRPAKASVELIARADHELTPATVRGVQRLVAAATPDLDVANVVVLDEHGDVVSSDAPPQAAAPTASQEQRGVEDYYAGLARNALDKALPNAGLTVTVRAEPAQAQDQAEPPESLEAALAKWTPGARRFRLQALVSAAAPLSATVQEQAKAAIGEAIGLDPALGDRVEISSAPPLPSADAGGRLEPQTARVEPSVQTRAQGADGLSPTLFWEAVSLPVLVAAGAVLVLLLRSRTKSGRALGPSEREAYVQRLRAALEREDGDVARRA